MLRLAELQGEMSRYLRSPPGEPASGSLVHSIRTSEADAQIRLSVYKNNVYVRLIDALGDAFPVVKRLVGDKFFRHAARTFAAGNPTSKRSLIGFGAEFPDFLESFGPARSVPYLADVARLEILYLESYHAPETWTQVARGAVPNAVEVHPSARLLRSEFAVSRIWEINRQSEDVRQVTIPPGPEHLLIIRPRAIVEIRRLRRGAYAMVQALMLGAAPEEAASMALEDDPDIDALQHFHGLARGNTFIFNAGSKNEDQRHISSARRARS